MINISCTNICALTTSYKTALRVAKTNLQLTLAKDISERLNQRYLLQTVWGIYNKKFMSGTTFSSGTIEWYFQKLANNMEDYQWIKES